LVLLSFARTHKLRDEKDKRQQLYFKSGSFAREVSLSNVPKDVSDASLRHCLWQNTAVNGIIDVAELQ
jgi:hypothetical protein